MSVIAGFEIPANLNTPTSLQTQASDLQRSFEREALPPIRADHTLSAEGKKIVIAAAFIPVLEGVADLQERERREYDRAITRTEQKLFGDVQGDAGLIGTRDAFDRAEQIPNTKDGEREASKLLARATKTNDDGLVRAIIVTAISRGWSRFLDTFLESNAGLKGPLEDYLELRRYDPDSTQMSYYTYRVTAPPEIAGIPLARLREIVAEGPSRKPADVYTNPGIGTGVTITDGQRDEFARQQAAARLRR